MKLALVKGIDLLFTSNCSLLFFLFVPGHVYLGEMTANFFVIFNHMCDLGRSLQERQFYSDFLSSCLEHWQRKQLYWSGFSDVAL